jgi:prepilin-type N-terminal cleavage/methylation domain-containing protein
VFERGGLASLKGGMGRADSWLVARREDGFTLLEMLVVLIILAILATTAVGFHRSARERAGDAAARINIRVATPALEAYRLDNDGSYSGVTVEDLQARYSPGVQGIEILSADDTSYCIRSAVEGRTWYKQGPQGQLTTTACA